MDISVQFGQVSHLIDLLVNNSQLANFNKVLYHHFKFFDKNLKLEVLNQIMIKRIGMKYGVGSSVRKRYFSDINYLLKRNYISLTEEFKPTQAAIDTERTIGKFEYSKISWRVSDENKISYDIGSDVEPADTNFSDRFGVVNQGKWKDARKKCLEKGLNIAPEETIIDHGKKGKKMAELSNMSGVISDNLRRLQRENRIKLLTERLRTREERREIRRQTLGVKEKIEQAARDIEKKEKELILEESKLEELKVKEQTFQEQNRVLYGPSGSEKSRRVYFEAAIKPNGNRGFYSGPERAAKATRVQLAKKLQPLGWVIEGISGSTIEADPNEQFRYVTYTSDKLKAEQGKGQPKEDKTIPILEEKIKKLNKSLQFEREEKERIKKFDGKILLSSGDEEEILNLKLGMDIDKGFFHGVSKTIKMASSSKAAPPTVIVMNQGNITDTKSVISMSQFCKPKKFSKRDIKLRDECKSKLAIHNRFSVLEYDDNMFANDVGVLIAKVGNLVECFKNVPLYKHIEKKKKQMKQETHKLINEAIAFKGEDFGVVINREEKIQCKKMQNKVRPNIYRTYKLTNSLNTLKKALFCARNDLYPTVNKEWADGVPVTLKRCQWHYLISTCRIALGMADISEVIKSDTADNDRNKFKKWVEESLF